MEIEDLSKDILEDNFLKSFRNMYYLQYLMGCSRIFIKNRFATPPTMLQKCYTILFLMFVSISSFLVTQIGGIHDMKHESVKTLAVSIIVIIYFLSACNIIHVRFLNSRRNAEFTVRMQNLDRLMKLSDDKNVNGNLQKINDFSLIIVALACGSQQTRAIAFIGTSFCAFTVVLELLHSSSLVCYFLFRIMYVNQQIQTFLKQEVNVRMPIILHVRKRWHNFLYTEDNDFATSNVNVYLREIFDLFHEFQELYKFQFLLFTVKLIVLNLLTFELAFYAVRNSIQITALQVFILYALIDVAFAGFTTFRFGVFYSEVKETKRYCISVMSLYDDGPLREKARCMLNLIQESPPKFSVYNMWEVDARHFVTLFSLVTGLIVSLTQLTIKLYKPLLK